MELSKKLLQKWKEMYNHREPQDNIFSKGNVTMKSLFSYIMMNSCLVSLS